MRIGCCIGIFVRNVIDILAVISSFNQTEAKTEKTIHTCSVDSSAIEKTSRKESRKRSCIFAEKIESEENSVAGNSQ